MVTGQVITDSSTEVSSHKSNDNPRKRKRAKRKHKIQKEDRQAQARQNLAMAKGEKKNEEINAKKKSSAPTLYATADYCDICQMTPRYKKNHMVLWKCRDCGVAVHDLCYGVAAELRGAPCPDFQCYACKAVGKEVQVREKDLFSGQHLVVKQKKRPTECCLCSVNYGIHAMHPIYDAHGRKGRQILLPPEKGNKNRRLAWAHTLCCLQVGSAVYGCNAQGWYDDKEDESSLLKEDDINPDLDVVTDDIALVNHFVYWGYLQQFKGIPESYWDDWAKSALKMKRGVKCQLCGKADYKTVTLPGGQEVFSSLRVAVQCSANNEAEFSGFKEHHTNDSTPCCVGVHVGCALWGRNDDGEYYRQRSVWFFPGLPGEDLDELEQNPIAEVYCPFHASDLFYKESLNKSSDMETKLPGPFVPLSEEEMNRLNLYQSKGSQRDAASEAGSRAGGAAEARLPKSRVSVPGVATGAAAAALQRKSSTSSAAPGLKKKPSASKQAHTAAVRSPTVPLQHNITLHGETKKKRPHVLKKAGEAVQVQTKKHGRLVSTSATKTSPQLKEGSFPREAGRVEKVQHLLDLLIERQEQCINKGKSFGVSERAKLRVQLLNEFQNVYTVADGEFSDIWKSANEALKKRARDALDRQQKQDNKKDDPLDLAEGPVDTSEDTTGTNQAVQQRHAESFEDPDAERVREITVDILRALDENRQSEEYEQPVVHRILKERKQFWKRESRLSRADFRILFKKVTVNLQAEAQWLIIHNSGEEASTIESCKSQGDNEQALPDVAELPLAALASHEKGAKKPNQADLEDRPVDNEAGNPEQEVPLIDEEKEGSKDLDVQDRPSVEGNNLEQLSSPSVPENRLVEADIPTPEGPVLDQRNEGYRDVGVQDELQSAPSVHDLGRERKSKTLNPLGSERWSFLHYGPAYQKYGFQFDKWDECEDIETLSSDDED